MEWSGEKRRGEKWDGMKRIAQNGLYLVNYRNNRVDRIGSKH